MEKAEALPSGSVAVAVIASPLAPFSGTLMLKTPIPLESVVTWPEPRKICPSCWPDRSVLVLS